MASSPFKTSPRRETFPARLRSDQRSPDVPIVTVQQSPRDIDAKRRLAAGITQAFVDAYGLRPEQVQVVIAEFDHEHWAKGGVLAADASAGHRWIQAD
jgi:4-oxalocrotonate tautomerase